MAFVSQNKDYKSLGLKLCALASIGVLTATSLSACGSNDDSDEPGFTKKALNFGGDMTLDDAYDVYDTANEEGDTDEWCLMQTVSIVLEDYDYSNIYHLVNNSKKFSDNWVTDHSRESCAHALVVADKRNQQTGEAYMSMKFTLSSDSVNNIEYVKKKARETYPDADIDLAFEELHEDKDKIFEGLDERVFNRAADLYQQSITPGVLDEALSTDNMDIDGNEIIHTPLPELISADQYRKALEEAEADMSDFAAYVVEDKVDPNHDDAVDWDKLHETGKTHYIDETPVEWVDSLVNEFKFTESEARSGAQYVLDYLKNPGTREPKLLVPYLFSDYVKGPDHTPVTHTLPNGEEVEFTKDVYEKAERKDDLSVWADGKLPVGVTIRESDKYNGRQIKKWQMDGTPLGSTS